jgi:hypothetical protein
MQNQALLEQVNAVWEGSSREAMVAIDRKDIQSAYDKGGGSLPA